MCSLYFFGWIILTLAVSMPAIYKIFDHPYNIFTKLLILFSSPILYYASNKIYIKLEKFSNEDEQ